MRHLLIGRSDKKELGITVANVRRPGVELMDAQVKGLSPLGLPKGGGLRRVQSSYSFDLLLE